MELAFLITLSTIFLVIVIQMIREKSTWTPAGMIDHETKPGLFITYVSLYIIIILLILIRIGVLILE